MESTLVARVRHTQLFLPILSISARRAANCVCVCLDVSRRKYAIRGLSLRRAPFGRSRSEKYYCCACCGVIHEYTLTFSWALLDWDGARTVSVSHDTTHRHTCDTLTQAPWPTPDRRAIAGADRAAMFCVHLSHPRRPRRAASLVSARREAQRAILTTRSPLGSSSPAR